MELPIRINQEAIQAVGRKYHAKTLSFFGSVLTERFGPDSDVDMVVEFLPDAAPTFIDLMQMQAELSELIGLRVDLRTVNELSRHFREEVIKGALIQYAA